MAALNSDEKYIIDIIEKHFTKYNRLTFNITYTNYINLEKSTVESY